MNKKRFLPLVPIFVIISFLWILNRVHFSEFIYLFLGLSIGTFILDIDHIIYWLYTNPNIEESRLAQIAIRKRDLSSVFKLLEATRKKHTSLIFHHFFFQIVLLLISIFIFTSTGNVFAMSLVLSLNIHLLTNEYEDYRRDPKYLQDWLFARESKQLPIKHLSKYIAFFAFFSIIFTLLLLQSRL